MTANRMTVSRPEQPCSAGVGFPDRLSAYRAIHLWGATLSGRSARLIPFRCSICGFFHVCPKAGEARQHPAERVGANASAP